MPRKNFNREQVQRCVSVLDELARSGLSTRAFAQAHGHSYGLLRGWLAHGPRWRAFLQGPGADPPALTRSANVAAPGRGFAQVKLVAAAEPMTPPKTPPSVRIECAQGQRSAVLHWPTEAPLECAPWQKLAAPLAITRM